MALQKNTPGLFRGLFGSFQKPIQKNAPVNVLGLFLGVLNASSGVFEAGLKQRPVGAFFFEKLIGIRAKTPLWRFWVDTMPYLTVLMVTISKE
jgi:hypothetical protein